VGRLRLSRVQRAFVGCLIGVVMAFAGLFLVLGIGWALTIVGVFTALVSAVLYDVDDTDTDDIRRRRGLP
jgi:membrane associated rhomboid family serine protease